MINKNVLWCSAKCLDTSATLSGTFLSIIVYLFDTLSEAVFKWVQQLGHKVAHLEMLLITKVWLTDCYCAAQGTYFWPQLPLLRLYFIIPDPQLWKASRFESFWVHFYIHSQHICNDYTKPQHLCCRWTTVYLYFDITNLNVLCVSEWVCVFTWLLYIYVLGVQILKRLTEAALHFRCLFLNTVTIKDIPKYLFYNVSI